MNVLVRGAFGNVGTTVTALLLDFRQALGINKVFTHKRTLLPWTLDAVDRIRAFGAIPCSDAPTPQFVELDRIKGDINYIFECGAEGVGLHERQDYSTYPKLLAACAQGSEKGFGIPYMLGVNDDIILGEQYVQVVSCNCHGIASLMAVFAGRGLEGLSEADFVVVRRSEDLGSHARLVGANVVVRHLDPPHGTHHARDVMDLFQTVAAYPTLRTSDINTPSQLLHSVRFAITLRSALGQNDIEARLAAAASVSTTKLFDSNAVFDTGRRHGFHGRLYDHAIVVSNMLMVEQATIRGWAFVPQEGATILSTIAAFLRQTRHPGTAAVLALLGKRLQTHSPRG
ncbi:MAG: hypothetical protein ABR551_02855 [Gemmatimonadales bacterium]